MRILLKSNKAVRFKRWVVPASWYPMVSAPLDHRASCSGWSRLRSPTGALSNRNYVLNFVMVVERSRGHHTSGRSRTLGFEFYFWWSSGAETTRPPRVAETTSTRKWQL
jgi:hypothetical protein